MRTRVVLGALLVVVLAGCGRGDDPVADATTTTAAPTTVATTITTTPPPEDVIYVVQSGDSLSTIAQRFGVSVDEIAQANGITDVNAIMAGQELVIPPSTTTTAPTTIAPTTIADDTTTTTASG
jgi:LysM repeat protein